MSQSLTIITVPLAVNIVRFRASDIGDLRNMRESGEVMRDAIDNYCSELWKKFLTPEIIDNAFEIGDNYIIEMALLSKWESDKFSFASRFVINKYHSIDLLLVKYGFIDKVGSYQTVAFSGTKSWDQTALTYSCQMRNYPRIRFLLENGANPRVKEHGLCVMFHWISTSGWHQMKNPEVMRIAKLFLSKGITPADANRALSYAHGDLQLMRLLIEEGKADLNSPRNCLSHYIRYDARVEAFALLIDSGVDVNREIQYTDTPPDNALAYACYSHSVSFDVVFLLIRSGGSFRYVEHSKLLCVLYTKTRKEDIHKIHLVMEAFLTERSIPFSRLADTRQNPLMFVQDIDTLKVIYEHIEAKCSENADVIEWRCVLASLYKRKHLDCIKYLLSKRRIDLASIYTFVERGTEGYEEIQKWFDDLLQSLHPCLDITPTTTVDVLYEYFTRTRKRADEITPIENGALEYVLHTRSALDLTILLTKLGHKGHTYSKKGLISVLMSIRGSY
jgi:hypothetical protein